MEPASSADPVLQGAAIQGVLPLVLLVVVPEPLAPFVLAFTGAAGALLAAHRLPVFRARRGVVLGVTTTALGIVLATLVALVWIGATPWGVPRTFLVAMANEPASLFAAVAAASFVGALRNPSVRPVRGSAA